MASINFQRHISVHLHNALTVQEPIDESGKVAEGRMRVQREQSKIPTFKSAKEAGQSLTGASVRRVQGTGEIHGFPLCLQESTDSRIIAIRRW